MQQNARSDIQPNHNYSQQHFNLPQPQQFSEHLNQKNLGQDAFVQWEAQYVQGKFYLADQASIQKLKKIQQLIQKQKMLIAQLQDQNISEKSYLSIQELNNVQNESFDNISQANLSILANRKDKAQQELLSQEHKYRQNIKKMQKKKAQIKKSLKMDQQIQISIKNQIKNEQVNNFEQQKKLQQKSIKEKTSKKQQNNGIQSKKVVEQQKNSQLLKSQDIKSIKSNQQKSNTNQQKSNKNLQKSNKNQQKSNKNIQNNDVNQVMQRKQNSKGKGMHIQERQVQNNLPVQIKLKQSILSQVKDSHHSKVTSKSKKQYSVKISSVKVPQINESIIQIQKRRKQQAQLSKSNVVSIKKASSKSKQSQGLNQLQNKSLRSSIIDKSKFQKLLEDKSSKSNEINVQDKIQIIQSQKQKQISHKSKQNSSKKVQSNNFIYVPHAPKEKSITNKSFKKDKSIQWSQIDVSMYGQTNMENHTSGLTNLQQSHISHLQTEKQVSNVDLSKLNMKKNKKQEIELAFEKKETQSIKQNSFKNINENSQSKGKSFIIQSRQGSVKQKIDKFQQTRRDHSLKANSGPSYRSRKTSSKKQFLQSQSSKKSSKIEMISRKSNKCQASQKQQKYKERQQLIVSKEQLMNLHNQIKLLQQKLQKVESKQSELQKERQLIILRKNIIISKQEQVQKQNQKSKQILNQKYQILKKSLQQQNLQVDNNINNCTQLKSKQQTIQQENHLQKSHINDKSIMNGSKSIKSGSKSINQQSNQQPNQQHILNQAENQIDQNQVQNESYTQKQVPKLQLDVENQPILSQNEINQLKQQQRFSINNDQFEDLKDSQQINTQMSIIQGKQNQKLAQSNKQQQKQKQKQIIKDFANQPNIQQQKQCSKQQLQQLQQQKIQLEARQLDKQAEGYATERLKLNEEINRLKKIIRDLQMQKIKSIDHQNNDQKQEQKKQMFQEETQNPNQIKGYIMNQFSKSKDQTYQSIHDVNQQNRREDIGKIVKNSPNKNNQSKINQEVIKKNSSFRINFTKKNSKNQDNQLPKALQSSQLFQQKQNKFEDPSIFDKLPLKKKNQSYPLDDKNLKSFRMIAKQASEQSKELKKNFNKQEVLQRFNETNREFNSFVESSRIINETQSNLSRSQKSFFNQSNSNAIKGLKSKNKQSKIQDEQPEHHNQTSYFLNNVTNSPLKHSFSRIVDQLKDQNPEQQDQQIPEIKISQIQISQLHSKPTIEMTQQELINLAIQTYKIFGIQVDPQDYQFTMKKYKNCIIFNKGNDTILWHYTGKFYMGGWKNKQTGQGEKSGEGIEIIPQKHIYKGQFLNGKKHGTGILKSDNGNIYDGQWIQGLKNGQGTYFDLTTKVLYSGQWKDGKKNGYGFLKFSQKQYYQGTFVKSIKQGYGVQVFVNGDKYKGQYKKGKFHGRGRYIWCNGSSYQGDFKQGMRHGNGSWKSARSNFDIYVGTYLNDKKCGFGRYVWANGCIYQGNFADDVKHGKGKMIYADGKQIKGEWSAGSLIEQSDGNKEKDYQQPLRKSVKNFQLHKHKL